MGDVVVMQPNSYYLSESMCSLDVSNTLRYTNKTPTAPIIGKKIVSEQQIPRGDDEKPAPFQIFTKKKRNEKSPTCINKQTKRVKLKSCSNRKPQQDNKNDYKNISMKKIKHIQVSKPPVNKSFKRTKASQKENVKEIPKDNNIRDVDRSMVYKPPSPSIENIIRNTLKRATISRMRQEKERKGLEDMKEIKKQELQQHNMQIREDNAKFKKVKFTPKYSWGVNQSRLKDPQRSRKSVDKSQYKRPKSSERVRTGLDTIKEIQMELGVVHYRSRSLSQKSEGDTPCRKNWQPNPEVKAYMKKQDLCRKQKLIYENLHRFAEESRRRAQLKKLESANKPLYFFKKRPKKSSKRPAKKKLQRFKNLLEKEIIKEESLEDQKSMSFVYDSNSAEEKSINIDIRVPELSHLSNRPLRIQSDSERDIESSDSGRVIDSSEDEEMSAKVEEIRNYAATRIQAHVRRFLVQRRLAQEESYESVDIQVKNIINRWNKNSHKSHSSDSSEPIKNSKALVIDIPSSNTSQISNEYLESVDEYSLNFHKASETPESSEHAELAVQESVEELAMDISQLQEKKIEYQEKLKEQLIWREAQMISLESLRKKEIRDMQIIAEKVGKSEELGEMLSNMVEKRYTQLSALFEENLKDVQDILVQDMNTEEREKFEETLEEKREEFSKLIENDSKTMEEYIEDIISRNEVQESETSSENRPVIYNPRTGSMISYEEDDYTKVPQRVSPNNRESLIQESTINQEDSEIYNEDSYQDIVRGIISSPSPDFSANDKMQEIVMLVSSPEQPQRRKFLKPESPPEPNFGIPDISTDSVQEISLLGQLHSDFAGGPSHTPEHIPERPSAPLQFEPGRGSPYVSTPPGLQSSSDNEISLIHLPENIDITPELVVDLAESIMLKLISDENIDARRDHPELHLDIVNIAAGPEASSSDEAQIQTDSNAVRKYIEEIFAQADRQQIQALLKVSLKRKPLEVLNKMQEIEIGSIIETEFLSVPEILTVHLYLSLENNREDATQPSNSPHINQLVIEAEHIHNKMIFDVTNEALQKYRPYGLKGQPMPWSIAMRWIGHNKDINAIIEEVKENIVDWSTIQAGKICTEDMLMSNGLLDEDLLQQVREERLASMLAEEIIEKDEMWTNYEFEETQVKLDLSDMILEVIAVEVIHILNG